MPQLVIRFPGSFRVCFPAFLCIYEIAAAGVTDITQKGLNICAQCLKRRYWCCNYPGMVLAPEYKNWIPENAHFTCIISAGGILLSLK